MKIHIYFFCKSFLIYNFVIGHELPKKGEISLVWSHFHETLNRNLGKHTAITTIIKSRNKRIFFVC